MSSAARFQILPRQQVKPFTIAELQAIRAAIANHPQYRHYSDFVSFLTNTACRFGEAAGLRWKHLSADYTTAWIGESISRGRSGTTKTGKARTIQLSPTLQAVLLSKYQQAKAKHKPDDLVFPAPKGGAIDDNRFRARCWTKILEICKIEYRKPYAIRHSAISHALAKGANPIALAEQTGHDNRVLLDPYAHAIDEVLPEKLYWFHPPGSVRVLWNAALVRDWLLNGDSPAHSKAIESFYKSLPSSQTERHYE